MSSGTRGNQDNQVTKLDSSYFFNPNWDWTQSIFNIFNPFFKVSYNYNYWFLAAGMAPVFYFVYLPLLCPYVTYIFAYYVINFDTAGKALDLPTQNSLRSTWYMVKYLFL